MLDMFASEEEFSKQLEVEKKKEELNVKKQNDIRQNAETVENQALKDNWDDKEGYYKPYVGEIFAYKYRVIEEPERAYSPLFSAALITRPMRPWRSKCFEASRR